MQRAEDSPASGVGDLPDALLARVFQLAGKAERQCQLVCRRWRDVWWSAPGLWQSFSSVAFDGAEPADNDAAAAYLTALLAALQRVGRLVESADLRGVGGMQWWARECGHEWRLAAALGLLAPQRLRALRLSTEEAQRHGCLISSPIGQQSGGFHAAPSLPAAAIRRIGRFHRRLEHLDLSSWQLPACIAPALLERCTRLQCLRLRARQLPRGAFYAILRSLPGLTELALRSAMPLGPQTADLTRLSGLRVLHLVQINSMATPLLPPDLALLPHLQLYQLLNSCGAIQLQIPDGWPHRVEFSRHGHGGGAALEMSTGGFEEEPPVRLEQLLHCLLPPGAELARLKLYGLTTSAAALALLQQAPGLTQLQLMSWGEDGDKPLPACLETYGGLRRLSLVRQGLADLPTCAFLPGKPPHRPARQHVEELHLRGNEFRSLPACLPAAVSLQALHLQGCSDLQLSSEDVDLLLALPALQLLDLRGTQACRWPADLARLALRPGLALLLDSEPWSDRYPVPDWTFEAAEGGLPWEVERQAEWRVARAMHAELAAAHAAAAAEAAGAQMEVEPAALPLGDELLPPQPQAEGNPDLWQMWQQLQLLQGQMQGLLGGQGAAAAVEEQGADELDEAAGQE